MDEKILKQIADELKLANDIKMVQLCLNMSQKPHFIAGLEIGADRLEKITNIINAYQMMKHRDRL